MIFGVRLIIVMKFQSARLSYQSTIYVFTTNLLLNRIVITHYKPTQSSKAQQISGYRFQDFLISFNLILIY